MSRRWNFLLPVACAVLPLQAMALLVVSVGNLDVPLAGYAGDPNLRLSAGGQITQTGGLSATGLGLMSGGMSILSSPANMVDVLAADVAGVLSFRNAGHLSIGSVTVDGFGVTGISTTNDNVLLNVGGNLSQTASVVASGLAVKASGTTALGTLANHVGVIAGDVQDSFAFRSASHLSIGSVTVDGFGVTGISTTNDNVLLNVGGNLSQTASVVASGLAVKASGTTALGTLANHVGVIAGDVQDSFAFRSASHLSIGSVTVDGFGVTGISTTNDNVLLNVGGNLSQTASVVASGLAVKASGTTALGTLANHVDMLAADTQAAFSYRNAGNLSIGSVTVDGFTVTGISSSAGDVELIGDGLAVLDIDAPISVTGELTISGFSSLTLNLAARQLQSATAIHFLELASILFDATNVSLFDGLEFEILDMPLFALDMPWDVSFSTTNLAHGFFLDTAGFGNSGRVIARSLAPNEVPEPPLVLLLVSAGAALFVQRRRLFARPHRRSSIPPRLCRRSSGT